MSYGVGMSGTCDPAIPLSQLSLTSKPLREKLRQRRNNDNVPLIHRCERITQLPRPARTFLLRCGISTGGLVYTRTYHMQRRASKNQVKHAVLMRTAMEQVGICTIVLVHDCWSRTRRMPAPSRAALIAVLLIRK